MRDWDSSHPKARLLERKRAAILAAARARFLASGFGDTTMEAVAAEADVSIMTLYRHARTKDELFEAVIAIECSSTALAREQPEFKGIALREALTTLGRLRLSATFAPERIAMIRAVVAETGRFPQLGEIVYRATVGSIRDTVLWLLSVHPEAVALRGSAPRAAQLFVDALAGDLVLRLLLGMTAEEGGTEGRERRIALATDAALRELNQPEDAERATA